MLEPKKILFNPEVFEKKPTSLSSLLSKKQLFTSKYSAGSFRKSFLSTPGLRKNLPQTSNMLLHRKPPARSPPPFSIFQDSGTSPRSECEIESLVLKNNTKVLVSSKLTALLMQIIKEFKSCQVITDSFSAETVIYKFLFSSELKPINSISDIHGEPTYVIMSSRKKIPETLKIMPNDWEIPHERNERRPFNCINMYESIIPSRRKNKKYHKSPLYVLKSNASQSKIAKSSEIIDSYDLSENSSMPRQIFPFVNGKKVKEGAGGFKKPVLLFDKQRNCSSTSLTSSPIPDVNRNHSVSAPKRSLKELVNIEEICIKYSLTRQEFINILSDFTYLKENNLRPTVEALKRAYSIKADVLRGINPKFYNNREIDWEDFVKFFVIVVLQRGKFEDLLEFIINFIVQVDELKGIESWASMIGPINQILVEKVEKLIKAALEFEDCTAYREKLRKKAKDEEVSLYDLRVLAGLILKHV